MVRTPPDEETIICAVLRVSDELKIGHRHVPLYPQSLAKYGVLPEDIAEGHLVNAMLRYAAAWQVGRPALKEPAADPPPKPQPMLLGVRRSDVLQWMGREAWPEDDADIVLTELGQTVPPEEISAGLEAGRKSGASIDLPANVIDRLNEIRG
jgi:hypothetical protein